jgi:hypothetical protein
VYRGSGIFLRLGFVPIFQRSPYPPKDVKGVQVVGIQGNLITFDAFGFLPGASMPLAEIGHSGVVVALDQDVQKSYVQGLLIILTS